MPGVKKYLKQTVALRRAGEPNDQGEPGYSEPETVGARKVAGFGRTVNDLGVEVPNRTTLLTEAEVSVGDLIDGVPVAGIEEIVDKRGKTIGYRVEL